MALRNKLIDLMNGSEEGADAVIKIVKDEGYIHLPTGKGRNTVVSTTNSDKPELKTQAEWETDAINAGWSKPGDNK